MPPDAHSPGSPSQALADLHLSLEGHSAPDTPPPPIVNGFKPTVNGVHHTGDEDGLDPISKLQQELERTREERDEFETQYRNLLGKLQTMRSSLGNKLKQDAVSTPNPRPLIPAHTHPPSGRARPTRTTYSSSHSAKRGSPLDGRGATKRGARLECGGGARLSGTRRDAARSLGRVVTARAGAPRSAH